MLYMIHWDEIIQEINLELLEKCGLHFERDFDLESYKQFFKDLGYENVEYHVADGRMPCAVALITCS